MNTNNDVIKITLAEEIKCNCHEISSMDKYKEEFKNYPDFVELLKVVNKEKAIQLPYSISSIKPIYSLVIDEKKGLRKSIDESDFLLNGEDLIKIIDKLLDIIGFKKIIQNYTIVGITSFVSRPNQKWVLFYYYNILFDKPLLKNYENNGELFNPQYFNEDNFVSWDEHRDLRKIIDISCEYILESVYKDKNWLEEFYTLSSEYYAIFRETIFRKENFSSWDAEVSFDKFYSNEEVVNGVDKVEFQEKWRKRKPNTEWVWGSSDWGSLGGMRFVFEKEYKKVDIKVKGFGLCEHLFGN